MPNRARVAVALSLILLVCPIIQAQKQTPKAASIGQLREQIRKMLAVDADTTTPPEVRSLNRELLKERRAQLRELLQQRLDSLLKYRADLKDAMTPDLDRSLRDRIAEVMAELEEVSDARGASSTPRAASRRSPSAVSQRAAVTPAAVRVKASASSAKSARRVQEEEPEEEEEDGEEKKVVVSTATTTTDSTPIIAVRVTDPNVTKLTVEVKKGDETVFEKDADEPIEVKGRGDDVTVPVRIKLAEGENIITVTGLTKKNEAREAEPVTVTLLDEDEPEAAAADDEEKLSASWIKIDKPKSGTIYEDRSLIDVGFTVEKPEGQDAKVIDEVFVAVVNNGLPVAQGSNSVQVPKKGAEKESLVAPVRIGLGKNEIRLFSAYLEGRPVDLATITVECTGDRCGAPVADDFSNTMHMRAIVGFEQAGASSAESRGQPFVDLFFFGPLHYGTTCKGQLRRWQQLVDKDGNPKFKGNGEPEMGYVLIEGFNDPDGCYPRWATWGNVRFSSVPQQVSAFGTFAANFVSPLAEGRLTELVQGFTYTAGLDRFLFSTDRDFASPIPGFRHRTSVYLSAGFGATSPLEPRRSAQIFNIPTASDPQRAAFIAEFPEANVPGAKYIAFVAPDRDKFLRQYYGGFRFKTHFIDKDGYVINRFPAVLDVGIGQNEAVTGGRLKGKVFRIEAFYPFPIRSANFMYLYGSAFMKAGGRKSIKTPFFLSAPATTVQLPNDEAVITTRQYDKDFYRIGIGVNLTELFNRRSSPPR